VDELSWALAQGRFTGHLAARSKVLAIVGKTKHELLFIR
jgi:hypothetical protein